MKTSALLASLLTALALSACGGDSGSTNSASATGGNAATSGSVCDEYEKAFADSIANVDAATKAELQKSFEQGKEAMKNLPADQRDAACKESLNALKGTPSAADTAEDAKETASEAAEEAKEAASEAAEEAASK
ncbi:DUF5339 family protein [Neisseria sp. P0008.S010]|uniref:DUF5339 family protein n=1 Tax=Neisseria sp. P0008.S010 TaxID=3436707 RepID=UPI003F7D50E3